MKWRRKNRFKKCCSYCFPWYFHSLVPPAAILNGICLPPTVSASKQNFISFFVPLNECFQWNHTSFCFADVSKKVARHDSANFFPSSVVTARSWCKSVLLPTKTTGTLKNSIFAHFNYDASFIHTSWRIDWNFLCTYCALPITSNNFS